MTILEEAKKGRISPQIEAAARREGMEPAKLAGLPDGQAWIVTHAAYAAELADRLR